MSLTNIFCLGQEIPFYVYNFNETISNHLRHNKLPYELPFLLYIKRNFPEHQEIIDIGANIGNHSLFFAKFLKNDRVHAFEPHQSNFELLQKNLAGQKCQLYNLALSNFEGELPLYNSQIENYGGFSLHSYSNGTSFKVLDSIPVRTLDSFNLNNITMIKIDVENHENEVLEGAKDTISRNKPIIFVENLYHGFPQVCPNPEPHAQIFHELNYIKRDTNILGGYMDLWVPK